MPKRMAKPRFRPKLVQPSIEVSIKGLAQPSTLGTEFMTYVLWAVSPDGRTSNLGEIMPTKRGRKGSAPPLRCRRSPCLLPQNPTFRCVCPAKCSILENETRKDTKGKIFIVNDYKLMKRSQYQKMGNPLGADARPQECSSGSVRGPQRAGNREVAGKPTNTRRRSFPKRKPA